jgi:hypothetical protein
MTKVALRWTSEGKRKRGRPKTTWRRTIENEIKERKLESLMMSVSVILQHSEPYRSTDSTQLL